MQKNLKPALWLIVFIVGLPQISETVYTPALPDIAKFLNISDAWAEYTLTIYLFGFAVGTFLWGKLSDQHGRRPFLLLGLFLYVVGCLGCYFSSAIEFLMLSRFVQAFGGSVGSVLGQAICRDAFQGQERGKVYSAVGSALAFSPALGPIVGGFVDQNFGWPFIFLLLIVLGVLVWFLTYAKLPETHHKDMQQKVAFKDVAKRLFRDKKVLSFGMLVAGCNGIGFSYYAEGSFYLIELLGLTPSLYGFSFLGIAAAGALGGYLSRKMHDVKSSWDILHDGLEVIVLGGLFFVGAITAGWLFGPFPQLAHIIITLTCMMVIMTGIGMTIPNALALALEDYRDTVGTAASLWGAFYYAVISLFTLGMGLLHNGTLYPMPVYFLMIGLFMLWVARRNLSSQSVG